MKKLLAVLVLVLFGTMSYAQWNGVTPGNLWMDQGNVGIGTSAPANDIQVYDGVGPATLLLHTNATPTGSPSYNLAQYEMRYISNTQYYYRNVLRKNMLNNHIEMLQTLRNPGGVLNFMLVDVDNGIMDIQAGITNVTFNNSGTFAIGMGTYAVPGTAKLAVGGKIVCKEVEVTLTDMPPDYVFGSDYKLLSLYDVDNFINTNKHLPGVPSATEMLSKGVNVGEMNMTLLQKVEELTLYMINLQKENDALKARVSNLEK
jgi:hypothetical protein